jgi:hypothetical protein
MYSTHEHSRNEAEKNFPSTERNLVNIPTPCDTIAPMCGGARRVILRGNKSSLACGRHSTPSCNNSPIGNSIAGSHVFESSCQASDRFAQCTVCMSTDNRCHPLCCDQNIGMRVKPTARPAAIAASPRGKSSSSTSFRGGVSSSRCQIRTKKV